MAGMFLSMKARYFIMNLYDIILLKKKIEI